jgi:3-phosphoshikimate 1-carboxyvinyltransferase
VSFNTEYFRVPAITELSGRARIPSSKPETQRAIATAALSSGSSRIYNDLRCLETSTMKAACRAIGAGIHEHGDFLEVQGNGGVLKADNRVIDARGSGLVFRLFSALTCFSPSAAVVSGDAILRTRVMAPLFDALRHLGARIEYVGDEGKAPIVNWGGGLRGGRCTLPGNVSSQFVTAIMFAAPLADDVTDIRVEGEILSVSYIRQTIAVLRKAGIRVEASDDCSHIIVHPQQYRAVTHHIGGDYTSASYLIGAAALFPGTTVFENIDKQSLQGERAIIDVLQALGIQMRFDDEHRTLTLSNPHEQLRGDVEFDASDFPNIVPTLAAIGAHVNGTFRVVGASITRLHKSSRVKAIVTELAKLGVNITPLFEDGAYDGFEIRGRGEIFKGGATLSSWKDHRIFMSLFITSLRCRQSNMIDGYHDVNCSFPDFFVQFERLGVPCGEAAGDQEAAGNEALQAAQAS